MYNLRDEKDITIIKEFVTWNDIEQFISFLEEKIGDFSQFTGVYGPARGGVIFAAIVSNRFNLPYLGAPCKGCLIVDDICDTGDTALAWCNKGYTVATMYYKTGAAVIPNYWWREKEDKWIVYPWEQNTLENEKGDIA